MNFRTIAIGLSALAAVSGSEAQERARPQRLAAVDASGRIVPVKPTGSPERISTQTAISPCKDSEPLSTDDARALVAKVAAAEDFYPDFVLSVAKSESQFNSVALSDKGAFGLMQLMPEIAQRFKVDICDPADNVRGGVRFLRTLHQKYRNPFFILAAYNAGEDALAKNRGVPPFPETVRFVAQVINDFYELPAPARSSRKGRGSRPDTPEVGTPSSAASASPQARWDSGFVMHVD